MNGILSTAAKHRILALGVLAVCWSMPGLGATVGRPETFASPEKAVAALAAAARNNDRAGLLRIYGAAGQNIVSSGDEVADKEAHTRFIDRYGKSEKILRDAANRATLVIGTEEWPFPIPIVRQGGVWHFDAEAGMQEILNRRVGRNELNAIEVCRSYVQAQRDYAADFSGDPKQTEYAQKIASSPGQRDGLYWPVQSGEKESPIGPLMARARAEGYGGGRDEGTHAPFHGYYYKILTRQGTAAPGGERNYIVDGHMTGGFALIAFPAKYGDSGVMTFIVNQSDIVYAKNLGPDTATVASSIVDFNPDRTWKTR